MKRHLCRILCGLSLVACIASAAMWARSSRHVDLLQVEMPYHTATLLSLPGGIYLEWMLLTFEQQEWRTEAGLENAAPQPGWHFKTGSDTFFDEVEAFDSRGMTSTNDETWQIDQIGFLLRHGKRNYESPPFLEGWQIGVPYWAIILLSGIVPLSEGIRWHRGRRRTQDGRCTACGYDLRATPLYCPECGKAPLARFGGRLQWSQAKYQKTEGDKGQSTPQTRRYGR